MGKPRLRSQLIDVSVLAWSFAEVSTCIEVDMLLPKSADSPDLLLL